MTLGATAQVSAAELFRLAKEHSSMTDLNLRPCPVRSDDAVAFIHQAKSLKMFQFRVQGKSVCNGYLGLNSPVYVIELNRKQG